MTSGDIAAWIGAGAGALGVIVAIWQLFGPPATGRAIRQQILDALPAAPHIATMRAYLDRGADWAGLVGSLSLPHSVIHKSLDRLVKENRVQIAIARDVADGSHPGVAAGTQMQVPVFFKGGISPSLRASDAEVEKLMKALASN